MIFDPSRCGGVGLSLAHLRSQFAIVDPFYGTRVVPPSPYLIDEGAAVWLYGDAELECHLLDLQVKQGFAVAKHVHYATNYHRPSPEAVFRIPAGLVELRLYSVGQISAFEDGECILTAPSSEAFHVIALSSSYRVLDIRLKTFTGEPPALLVSQKVWQKGDVFWSVDGRDWTKVKTVPASVPLVPPHRKNSPTAFVEPRKVCEDGIIDFGQELLGRLHFESPNRVEAIVGESMEEALESDLAIHEQHLDIERHPSGGWVTRYALGFRYARLGPDASRARCEVALPETAYHGAFACSDERLTRIWMTAAYTLRLCMQQVMVDGIKRDRMPWIGDQAVNLLVNAHTFADAGIVRRSFTALGRTPPSEGDINGIVDYSLWWIINHDVYQTYFRDLPYLEEEWLRIEARLESLLRRCDKRGYISTSPEEWVFIDWGIEKADGGVLTALQILWFWALSAGSALAERLDYLPAARKYRTLAKRLAYRLSEDALDANGCWLHYLGKKSPPGKIANALAVISGLARQEAFPEIRKVLSSFELASAEISTGPVGVGSVAVAHARLAKLGVIENFCQPSEARVRPKIC